MLEFRDKCKNVNEYMYSLKKDMHDLMRWHGLHGDMVGLMMGHACMLREIASGDLLFRYRRFLT